MPMAISSPFQYMFPPHFNTHVHRSSHTISLLIWMLLDVSRNINAGWFELSLAIPPMSAFEFNFPFQCHSNTHLNRISTLHHLINCTSCIQVLSTHSHFNNPPQVMPRLMPIHDFNNTSLAIPIINFSTLLWRMCEGVGPSLWLR